MEQKTISESERALEAVRPAPGEGKTMRFARSFRSAVAGILALLVLVVIWMLIIDYRCSRNVSADETAGMAGQQIPFKE